MKIKSGIAFILLILFILLTVFVGQGLLSGVDIRTTRLFQLFIPHVFDLPFSLLSLLGSVELVSVIILILWFNYKKLNILFVLFNFAIFHIIELFLKAKIAHLGPAHEFLRYYFNFSFPSSSVKPGYSYPSGHVGRTAFVSVMLLYVVGKSNRLSKKKKNLIYFLVIMVNLLMIVSRVYLGEHWLSDVAGGGILGAFFALLSLIFI